MKILFVCNELPSPADASSLRVLHSLKYLAKKHEHDITLVAFKLKGKKYPDLSDYCHIETVDIACRPGFESLQSIWLALRQIINPRSLLLRLPIFFKYFYSAEVAGKVRELINKGGFEVMALDAPQMLCYTDNKVPSVLLETFAMTEMVRYQYMLERHWFKKIIRLLYYYQTKNRESIYRRARVCVAVSKHQRDMVKAHCPDLDIRVIPHGIDTDYLHAVENEAEFPYLVISGTMGGLRNQTAVLAFYHNIFPSIKAKVPDVKLYIVGRDPGEKILNLAKDKSVVVTGYVEDIRPYLSRAWVVVAPLQEGFGVKTRVLQAMSMGKPVVATSMVSAGIDVSSGENIVLADEPQDFVGRVVELLNDKKLREKIGGGARWLMQTEHDWEKLTDRLNEVFNQVATEKLRS